MKKFIALLVCLVLFLGISKSALAASANPFNIKLNGEYTKVYDVNLVLGDKKINSEFKPYIYNNRTFVPIRLVAEHFNSKVTWNQETKSAIITKDGNVIVISIDSREALKNGEPITLDESSIPRLVSYPNGGDKTMVPLRVVSELLGYEVAWKQELRQVSIKSKDATVAKKPVEDKKTIAPQITAISKVNGSSKNEQIKLVANEKISYTSNFEAEKNAVAIDIKGLTFNINGKTAGNMKISGKVVDNVEYSSDAATNSAKVRIQLNRYVEHNIKVQKSGKELNISFTNQVTGIRPIVYNGQNAILIENVQDNEHNIIKLQNPFRYIIDIKDATLISDKTAAKFDIEAGFVSGVRANQFVPDGNYSKNDNIVRVVLDSKDGINNGEVKLIKSGLDMIVIPQDAKSSDSSKVITDTSEIPTNPINDNKHVDEEKAFDNVEEIEVVERKPRIKPNSKSEVVIVIDPGHGGNDPGAIAPNGTTEKELNINISERVNRILSDYGYSIVMTRQTDKTLNIYDRPKMANEANAHVFVSIHANSSPNEEANGIESLYAPRDTTSVKYDPQYPLAQKIHYELIKETGMFSRGIKQRPDLIVLKHTEMPAVLVELGFMSNSLDMNIMETEDFRNACAKAISNGIIAYIQETYGY